MKTLSVFLFGLLAISVSGCYLTDPINTNGSSSSGVTNFYAHCTNASQSSVIDVQGSTGIAAASDGTQEQNGSGHLSENSDQCLSTWIPVSIQPNWNGTTESLSIYSPGTSLVVLNLDITPLRQNPTATSWQSNAMIESGILNGQAMSCTLYVGSYSTGSCNPGANSLVSCQALGFQICNQ